MNQREKIDSEQLSDHEVVSLSLLKGRRELWKVIYDRYATNLVTDSHYRCLYYT